MAERDIDNMSPIHNWLRRFWYSITYPRIITENYILQRGDTPEHVARKFNMPLRTFININNIKSKGTNRDRKFIGFTIGDTVKIEKGHRYLPYSISDKLKEAVKQAEGFHGTVYKDIKGVPTIGYGFTDKKLINEKRMSRERAEYVLDSLLNIHTQDVVRNTPNIDLVDQPFLDGTVLYHYRVGDSQYSLDHPNMVKAFENKDFKEASNQMDAGSSRGEINRKKFEKGIRDNNNYVKNYRKGGKWIENFMKRINELDKNFVKRLQDPNRKSIKVQINPVNNNYRTYLYPTIGTHKMSYVTHENNEATIYPEIQEINGKLIDTSNPPYDAYRSAIIGNDTIITTPEVAKWFTTNYKKYFPNF